MIISHARDAGVSLLALPDGALGRVPHGPARARRGRPAAAARAERRRGPVGDRLRRRHGGVPRVQRAGSRRGRTGWSATTRRSASPATASSGGTARSTCPPASRRCSRRATGSARSTPRWAGWACSSTTTRPSRRRRAPWPSTAPRSSRCLSAWPTSLTHRAPRMAQDRQARLFDLYDQARAAENQVVWLSANQSGRYGALHFLGRAKVVGPGGEILARTWSKGGLAVAEVDLPGAGRGGPGRAAPPRRAPSGDLRSDRADRPADLLDEAARRCRAHARAGRGVRPGRARR